MVCLLPDAAGTAHNNSNTIYDLNLLGGRKNTQLLHSAKHPSSLGSRPAVFHDGSMLRLYGEVWVWSFIGP